MPLIVTAFQEAKRAILAAPILQLGRVAPYMSKR
jgi:hypothetical protein